MSGREANGKGAVLGVGLAGGELGLRRRRFQVPQAFTKDRKD